MNIGADIRDFITKEHSKAITNVQFSAAYLLGGRLLEWNSYLMTYHRSRESPSILTNFAVKSFHHFSLMMWFVLTGCSLREKIDLQLAAGLRQNWHSFDLASFASSDDGPGAQQWLDGLPQRFVICYIDARSSRTLVTVTFSWFVKLLTFGFAPLKTSNADNCRS